jgi:hypothetical protein
MSNIVTLKLVTGEEVVATLVQKLSATLDSNVAAYRVSKPQTLQFRPFGNSGQMGLAFMPWVLSNPGLREVDIPATFVMAVVDTDNEVARQYTEQTTGIALI